MHHVAKITFENFISMPPCTMPGADIFNTGIFYLPYDGIDFFIRFVKQMKSADNTRAKSLKVYMDTYKPAYAIKLSAKNFAFEDNKKVVPLYAAFCI